MDLRVNKDANDMQEKNFEFIRENFLHKEMEAYGSFMNLTKKHEVEIELMKRKFEMEKNDYKRIIGIKNQEIEGYRIELEGILGELDLMRKTQRETKNTENF